MAATSVGSVPELVRMILDHFNGDRKALAAALQVNTIWFPMAAALLWQTTDVKRLCQLAPRRRQMYAAMLTDVEFPWLEVSDMRGDIHVIRALSGYDFLSLRILTVGSAFSRRPSQLTLELRDTINLSNFCHLPLRTFEYYGGLRLNPTIFRRLGKTCRMLENLHLEGLDTVDMHSDLMLRFLRSLPSIQNMVFGQGTAHILDQSVITHIARRKRLLKLHWQVELNTSNLDTILSTIHHKDIFPSLQNLRTYIGEQIGSTDTRPVKLLLRSLNSLSRLSLSNGNEDGIAWELEWVSHMTNLVFLNLNFGGQFSITSEGLRSLGSLRKLEKLQIGSSQNVFPTATGLHLSPEDFEYVFARLKFLEKFFFNVDVTPATAHGIITALSHHCRDFQQIRAQQLVVDFGACRFRDDIWFPSLLRLEIGAFTTDLPPDLDETTRLGTNLGMSLHQMCPRLLYATALQHRAGLYSEVAVETFRRLRLRYPHMM